MEPGKWQHGPKPAVAWWFNFDPPEWLQRIASTASRHSNRRAPALRVTVYSAKNLPPADVNGKADPYCTMQLAGVVESQ